MADEYDEDGNHLGWTYYGPDGEMMYNEVIGYAKISYLYDEQGQYTGTVRYDENGEEIAP